MGQAVEYIEDAFGTDGRVDGLVPPSGYGSKSGPGYHPSGNRWKSLNALLSLIQYLYLLTVDIGCDTGNQNVDKDTNETLEDTIHEALEGMGRTML